MLNRLLKKGQSGFTIIEVMIVLAIAGLIMVVVLVAIPQLQKNQRNEARRNVTARISAEISNYIGNNGGEIPTEDANTATGFTGGFKVRYIDNAPAGTFDAPGGGSYVYDLYDEGSPEVAENEIRYSEGAICSGEAATNGNGANARNFALLVGLEGGAIFCVDNR
jgi:prepilin-type N-terminal cleavage/methylation domain-containing protein